jgi:hypothetical protein
MLKKTSKIVALLALLVLLAGSFPAFAEPPDPAAGPGVSRSTVRQSPSLDDWLQYLATWMNRLVSGVASTPDTKPAPSDSGPVLVSMEGPHGDPDG